MRRILTVCTANICRSPLAERALARALPGVEVGSAGLEALSGMPADALAVAAGAQHGLELGEHRARQLAGWMCQQAELILVMELRQQRALEERFPLACGKVFRLGHYGGFDVADPYGHSRVAFDAACAAIERGVADWAPRIRRLT